MKSLRRVPLRRALAAASLLLVAHTVAAQSHFAEPMFKDGMENVTDGPFDNAEAARFLAQATFGPTDADIAHLRAVGYNAWLNEQFAAPESSPMTYYNWVKNVELERTGTYTTFREAWFLGALGGLDPQTGISHTDQLRQRVAFALSEIFVVSDQNAALTRWDNSIPYHYSLLTNNAFGNYRTLLEQVTLSPAMGWYLTMLGNPRPDLANNVHPDENYAREINQLFSVGLVLLNPDGTPKLSAGQPIPTYNQAVITAFAHVFTGWTFYDCTPSNVDDFKNCSADSSNGIAYQTPMAPIAAYHDNGAAGTDDLQNKKLLSYTKLDGTPVSGLMPNGGSPQQDLAFALDNIYNHPNVGPFISKQLIQRLVTSNPTPAYVARVSAKFDNDGTGVRGNLKAVVTQILLDPEARAGQYWRPTTFGKMREPLLRMTHFWRAMGAKHACGTDYYVGNDPPVLHHYAGFPTRYAGYLSYGIDDSLYGNGVAQAPLDAPSVFNFFKPGYVPPGEMAAAGLLGPEFQIDTDSIQVNATNNLLEVTRRFDVADACGGDYEYGQMKINRAQDFALAGSANGGVADPADRLVDAYNLRFMSGQMSPFMRQVLLDDLNPISNAFDGANWKQVRISHALLLILTSPEYIIQK